MKRTYPYLLGLLCLPLLSGCDLDVVKPGGKNAFELARTLLHYKFIDANPQKYEAAYFLIKHMPYHYSRGEVVTDNDTLKRWMAHRQPLLWCGKGV